LAARGEHFANVWQNHPQFAKHWQNSKIARRMPRVLHSSLFSLHSSLRGGLATALPPSYNRRMLPNAPTQSDLPVLPAPVSIDDGFIKSRILTVRGVQVILSSDLAELYEVEVKYLHRQVKRNANRFPSDFVLHLSPGDTRALRCQNDTSKRGGDRYGLLAFTEQGVAMLSSVLKSGRAAEVNVAIMRVFVAMRRALASVAPILARIETAERRQIADQARNEERFDAIFKAMDGGDFPPQKVFFEGRHYDGWSFAVKLAKKARESIVLVDGYCDETTLDILANKRGGVAVTVATAASAGKRLVAAAAKFNK
jgi:hypothetical protein